MTIMQWGPIPPSGGPLRERYLDQHGREALEIADSAYAETIRLLDSRITLMPALDFELVEPDDRRRRAIQREKGAQWHKFRAQTDQATLDAVEPHIKQSIKASMNALNYLEDHPLREEAHAAIHRAAFVNRGLFGCPITLRDDEYWTDCPINISHLRMGVSAGLVSDFECSVCGELVENCDHQAGQTYPKVAELSTGGTCTICNSVECEHRQGETYLVRAFGNARNARASEVSFVARPRYPLARITDQSWDMEDMHDDPIVKRAAERGELNCDGDLGPCKGLNEMRDWNLRDGSDLNGNDPQPE